MSCDDVLPQLTAFVDGEVSAIAVYRIRRHLRHCADCAAHVVGIESVSHAAMRLYAEVPTPTSLHGRFSTEVTDEPTAPRPQAVLRPRAKTATGARVAPFAIGRAGFAAGLAGLAGAAAIGFSLLESSRPEIAFADVERAMQGFHTIHLHGVLHFHIKNAPDSVRVWDVWGRSDKDKPALSFLETGEPGNRSIRWTWDRTRITARPTGKNPQTYPLQKGANRQASLQDLLNECLFLPTGFTPARPTASLPPFFSWKSEKRVSLDGRSAIRFDGSPRPKHGPADPHASVTVYVDPETDRMMRSEIHTGPVDFVYTDFTYDQTPPPDVFVDAR